MEEKKNEIVLFENQGVKLEENSVCSFFEHTAEDGKNYNEFFE